MAHRTTEALLAGPSFWLKPSGIAPLRQAEEQQPIPASAGHLARDGAEGPVTPRVELKAVCEHLHDDVTVAQSACKQCARRRQSPVSLRLGASNHTYRIRGNLTGQQFLRCPGAESISDDLGGAAARRRARSLRPPSASACKRQTMRRNRNCLFEDFDSSPNASWYFFRNPITFELRNSSIAASTAGAMSGSFLWL